jgi:hypothetical protein
MNRWWKATVAALSLGGVALWGVGFLAFEPVETAGSAPRGSPGATPQQSADDADLVAAPALAVFAVGEGVRLRLPATSPVATAFHEASYRDAVRLRPFGVCRVCRNRWKYTPPPPLDRSLSYMVMDTRGRSQPATSAVDIVVRRRTEIVSPVDGVVRRVKRYRLYGRYRDIRVEIRPKGERRRRVVMLHLSHVRLRRGDRVEASVTRIGQARKLPFESQVDRYVPDRYPHVHVEVKRPASRRGPA